MSQLSSQGPVIQVKPQPNVYTVLLVVAAVALAVTIGLVLYNLMAEPPAGYGLSFGDLLGPLTTSTPNP
jgi:ABC-type dipeptide/oligopeptide/nickel transport system permease component